MMYKIEVSTSEDKYPIIMTTEDDDSRVKTIVSMNVTAAEDMITNLRNAIKMVKSCQSETTQEPTCQS